MANSIQWFFAHAGKQNGPVDDSAFRAMATRGEIGRDDLVWRAGMAQWGPASSVDGLFPPLAPVQPPPIPPLSSQPRAVGYFTPPPPSDPGQDPKMRMLLPVG